ncbi:MAG: phosphate/phosphite/phosphonate ABC transporter substrate-binding protein [Rehaibacterium terrae]|uniref:phosphate/phosphite/phosphonate ABC transporter substrate-binding protein n=1 Tax=Rehaibacterium terrae TaxID=1341696 RepID=UPI00391AA6D4
MNRHSGLLAAFALILASGQALAETYTVSVEPSYPPAQAEEVYRPLLDYLGKATGHHFVLSVPRNYHLLWRDIRANAEVHFAFEEAHLTDYRASRFGFQPLARTAETTSYALIAQPDVARRGVEGLVGYRVISMPSPSLGYALLGELYRNPVAQPDVQSAAASWRDGVEMIFSGEAEAAMVPSHIAQLYPNLEPVHRTRSFPGSAFSASPAVPEEVKQAVREALLRLHEDPELFDVLTELGASRFEPTDAAEYRGHERMLSGFFGYKSR